MVVCGCGFDHSAEYDGSFSSLTIAVTSVPSRKAIVPLTITLVGYHARLF